ncbi:DUF4856 domain-containing protein [Flammeovirga agarivorans]|uniref:DUF4856 domain-containing protein n=1 Tax=Flammeovirga agarivorans TaxID=2726742 RepID=A0A7X8SL76_9BACT|nr:DUF4856 domain-containing protein [Flammeovirga agarivorans]NLR92278.1 DUF4856 domain-containing protein [Flammeovirga agarivorans]
MNFFSNHFKKTLVMSSIAIAFFSCEDSNDAAPSTPVNYDFENVDYSGQTARIMMLDSLEGYIKSGNDGVTKLSAATMNAIYTNESGDLFGSSKDLESKTANDDNLLANVYTLLPDYFAGAEAYSGSEDNVIDGRLYMPNGHEPAQIVGKGLMGATLYYQSVSNYLTDEKLDGADNETVVEGEGTDMEHFWDEGFGYFGAATDYTTNDDATNYYWASYAKKRASVYDVSADIFNAFIAGRVAISAKDYDERNAQRDIILEKWEELVAINVVHYCNSVLSDTEVGDIYHHHSEALAFAVGLQYNSSKKISDEGLTNLLIALNVSTVTSSKEEIDTAMEAAKAVIKEAYGFDDDVMSNL